MTHRGLFPAMLYGFITVLFIALSFSLVISLILSFSSLTETSFSWIILIVSFLALFIGGLISGAKSKHKGWLTGLGTGLLFTVVTFLVQFLGYNNGFSVEQYLFHGGYVFSAILGGIIGVNLSK